jgi:hypothetical protein
MSSCILSRKDKTTYAEAPGRPETAPYDQVQATRSIVADCMAGRRSRVSVTTSRGAESWKGSGRPKPWTRPTAACSSCFGSGGGNRVRPSGADSVQPAIEPSDPLPNSCSVPCASTWLLFGMLELTAVHCRSPLEMGDISGPNRPVAASNPVPNQRPNAPPSFLCP